MERHEEWRAALSACRDLDVEQYWTLAEAVADTTAVNVAEVDVQLGLLRELMRPESMGENDLERRLIVGLCDATGRLVTG
jgi:hypothetical protein